MSYHNIMLCQKRILSAMLCMSLCTVAAHLHAAQAQATPAAVVNAATVTDVDTIRQRRYAAEIASDPKAMALLVEQAPRYFASLGPDGSWTDIDYKDQTPSTWKTSAHLDRVLLLARAYKTPGHPLFQSPTAKTKLLVALDFWLRNDFQNPNWWHNMIGAPLKLGSIMLLMRGETSDAENQKAIAILSRPKLGKVTGANLSWYVRIQIVRGCLENSPDVVNEAFQALWNEIHIAKQPKDGIQADYSFHQHGALLYSGGYGASFMKDCVSYVADARGTHFAIPPDHLKILEGYVLDGERWMTRGVIFDPGTIGREITRASGDSGDMSFMTRIAETLAEEPGGRQAECAAYAARLKAAPGGEPMDGNRQFYDSDFMVHERPGYYTSARMYSTRTLNTDGFINGEGKTSHYVADGVNYIFRRGDEYKNIFPVWDWRRVPGATVEQDPAPLDPKKVHFNGTTNFVGGVSDGKYGAAAMDLAHGKLTAHKAWFFFDDEWICLGTSIACPTPNDVLTSVNQCLLNGDVHIGGQPAPLATGTHPLPNTAWVLHDGVGYVFPTGTMLHVANQVQTGKWAEIGAGSPAPVSQDVFSLWIDHGPNPANASYEYTVVPNTDAAALDARAAMTDHPVIETLANTQTLQAVRHNVAKIVEAAFWKSGRLEGGSGWNVEVDQPCLLLLRETPDGVEIAVANPENQSLSVNVTIDRKLTGAGASPTATGTTVHFDLPAGRYAGRSEVRTLRP